MKEVNWQFRFFLLLRIFLFLSKDKTTEFSVKMISDFISKILKFSVHEMFLHI